jgi:hypothetical protein
MVLKFGGAVTLPQAYEVHFALDKTGDAVTQIGGADGVTVPDSMFTSGSPIYAWVYLHDGETDGYTQYTAIIPVIKRAAPSDQELTPVQQSAIDQAIAALGVAVEQTAADVETTTEKAAEAQASAEAAAASAAEALRSPTPFRKCRRVTLTRRVLPSWRLHPSASLGWLSLACSQFVFSAVALMQNSLRRRAQATPAHAFS